ncbi:MAG: 4Fe-4S dicluster domain-containing protein [Desulfopila sp.]
MNRYRMIIDVAKCENCNNCFLSCKDEHCGNDWPGYAASQPLHGQRWMNIHRRERGQFPLIDVAYRPAPCMHCEEPACLAAAENGAVVKRDDGIVLIDPERASGQKSLVKSCPYGAIWWNEEREIPQKCTFCAHLLDSADWQEPRCVQACPTGALSFVSIDDDAMAQLVAQENLQAPPGGGAGTTAVYYKNLYRFDACFIAGSIATGNADFSECAVGVTVELLDKEQKVMTVQSDDFGDFKFDGLKNDNGRYLVVIRPENGAERQIEVHLTTSRTLETVWI